MSAEVRPPGRSVPGDSSDQEERNRIERMATDTDSASPTKKSSLFEEKNLCRDAFVLQFSLISQILFRGRDCMRRRSACFPLVAVFLPMVANAAFVAMSDWDFSNSAGAAFEPAFTLLSNTELVLQRKPAFFGCLVEQLQHCGERIFCIPFYVFFGIIHTLRVCPRSGRASSTIVVP